jgi:hypothetical protein
MAFMREFVSDAGCLDWLWRTGYSEDGAHAYCPKCARERAGLGKRTCVIS